MTVPEVFESTEALGAAFAGATAALATNAIRARGVFSMALTGGSAASSLYPILAKADLPWASVHILFGDERCVAPDHADSNYRLATETLLSRISIPSENVHRMCEIGRAHV